MPMFVEAVRQISPEIAVILVAALPVVELRGAIPLAFSMGMPPLKAFTLALVGNLVPIPLLYLLLEPVMEKARRNAFLRRPVEWLYRRTENRTGRVQAYGLVGIVLLVAVPLPSTGAWTGTMVATFLGLPFRRAFPALVLGTALAGVLVTTMVFLGKLTVELVANPFQR